MKSAYELALERLESQGIERPNQETLSEATKQAIAEARRITEAKLAELDILHRDQLRKTGDPTQRAELELQYRREKELIESEGDSRVRRLRAQGTTPEP